MRAAAISSSVKYVKYDSMVFQGHLRGHRHQIRQDGVDPAPAVSKQHGKRVGEDYNSQRAVRPSMLEVVVLADHALGIAGTSARISA